jgi:hypothetical protein
MGGLSSTAGNILDFHVFILPIRLLFHKLLLRAVLQLCALPLTHPLHLPLLSVAHHKVKCHLSLLNHLLHFTQVDPKVVETISPVRRSPGYILAFKTIIPPDKDEAFAMVVITNEMAPVHIYTDGSGFEGGIRSAALLYIRECLVKVLQVHLGSALEHTVYQAEGIGLLLGLHLLKGLSCQLTHATVLGTDNQAVIKALENQSPCAR